MITFLSVAANATSAHPDTFLEKYAPEFEITNVSPICPKIPGRISCMAIGTIVKMKATLNGCMDRLIHFSNQVELSGDKAIIHISSVAVVDPRSASTRCVRMPEVTKTVSISSGMMNVSLEQKDLIEEEGKPYIVEMTLTSVTPLCPASSLGYQCRAIGPHALLQGSLNGSMDKIVSMEFDNTFKLLKQ